jgi:hypothetical protein
MPVNAKRLHGAIRLPYAGQTGAKSDGFREART